jgi:hypothetical protein
MLGRGPKVANYDPALRPSAKVPIRSHWRPSFASIVEISQSLRGSGIALVAFLQIKQSHAELRHS